MGSGSHKNSSPFPQLVRDPGHMTISRSAHTRLAGRRYLAGKGRSPARQSVYSHVLPAFKPCFLREMCYVIVTSRTLLWTLLTIATTLAMLAAVVTPSWLIGAPRRPGLKTRGEMSERDLYSPSLGIYNRCIKIHEINRIYTDNCAPFVTSFGMPSDQFPNFWKASLIFFGCGLSLMMFTLLTSILGCCFRSIMKKSIFTISGTIQAIAGLFFILGLMLYPAGWSSRRVHLICGDKAEPFLPGDCTLGLAFYLAIGSTLVTFICSVLSVQAEVSTSTDKVQDEILEGKTLICLL